MNLEQLLGYQTFRVSQDESPPKFEGAYPIVPLGDLQNCERNAKIFSTAIHKVQSWFFQEHSAYVYLVGNPIHPEHSGLDLLKWCLQLISEKRYEEFKELLGPFIFLVDEPVQHRITFVTDILGVFPMFHTFQGGRFVFGNDVWALHRARVGDGKIDYDAVSAWVVYGFNCTEQSLFSCLRRLAPGSVTVVQEGHQSEHPYCSFEPSSRKLSTDRMVQEIHGMVSSAVESLVSRQATVCLALSGGYDSRYLLALISSLTAISVKCCTVSFTKEEGQISRQVAESLGVNLEEIPVGDSIWDLYDQVFHFSGDGFPISKFVTYCVAQHWPGIPMINGFMGDSLIRGSKDMFLGKYEHEMRESLVDVLQQKHMLTHCQSFRPERAARILSRSRVPMEHAVKIGSSLGKIFGWADFYYRQRYYISNNFLQHLHLSDVILPFYNWNLLSYKMGHDYSLFTPEVYRRIFEIFFPRLSLIPRTSDVKSPTSKTFGVAQWTKQWAWEILPSVLTSQRLSLLEKRRSIPLMGAGLLGMRKAESSIFLFKRLFVLEEACKRFGLDFDWEAI